MTTIRLNREWALGDLIDAGGFGRVYAGKADDGAAVAIKLVPKIPGASRELLFEPISGLPNVIPIIDTGSWNDEYVLVMPVAEKSLRHYLDVSGGRLPLDEALVVLTNVAQALSDLAAQGVVHRDLKPQNVLLWQDRWCLVDFGIARYAEMATSPDTRKFAMTPEYASPEQWRGERATSATDVYALGVLAFEMLEGRLPFPGPDTPDFRSQHLSLPPPGLTGSPPSLASLIQECLFKAPEARPSPTNILARLQSLGRATSPGAERLQTANRAIVEKAASAMSEASAEQTRAERRSDLYAAAEISMTRIVDVLQERVREAAPSASVTVTPTETVIRLGNGLLGIESIKRAPADCLAAFDYAPGFDVIAYGAIAARKPRDMYEYEGRAHSLWFCDAHDEGTYRWFELAFMIQPLIPQRFTLDPFALPPTDSDAAGAFTPVMTTRQVAWAPVPIDQGDEGRFIERWLTWFAAAADGTLSHPSSMPEASGGRWRFSQQRRG